MPNTLVINLKSGNNKELGLNKYQIYL